MLCLSSNSSLYFEPWWCNYKLWTFFSSSQFISALATSRLQFKYQLEKKRWCEEAVMPFLYATSQAHILCPSTAWGCLQLSTTVHTFKSLSSRTVPFQSISDKTIRSGKNFWLPFSCKCIHLYREASRNYKIITTQLGLLLCVISTIIDFHNVKVVRQPLGFATSPCLRFFVNTVIMFMVYVYCLYLCLQRFISYSHTNGKVLCII
jgi:hypothetical protein